MRTDRYPGIPNVHDLLNTPLILYSGMATTPTSPTSTANLTPPAPPLSPRRRRWGDYTRPDTIKERVVYYGQKLDLQHSDFLHLPARKTPPPPPPVICFLVHLYNHWAFPPSWPDSECFMFMAIIATYEHVLAAMQYTRIASTDRPIHPPTHPSHWSSVSYKKADQIQSPQGVHEIEGSEQGGG